MELIKHTKFLDFKSTKSPSGNDWYYVKRTNDTNAHDSAVVITVLVKNTTNSYDFLLLKTSRPPLTAESKAKYCIECPAGLIGDIKTSESLLECAKKELKEEAGLIADKLYVECTNCSASSGLTSETLSYVTAIVEEYNIISKPITDGGIIVNRFLVDKNEIIDYITNLDKKENSIASATVAGIFFALNRLNSLK